MSQIEPKNITLRSTTKLWIFTCHTLIINLVWLRRTTHDKVPIRLPRVIFGLTERKWVIKQIGCYKYSPTFVTQISKYNNDGAYFEIMFTASSKMRKLRNNLSQLVRTPTSWSPLYTTIRTVRFWFGTRRTVRPSQNFKRIYSRTLIAPRPQPPKKEKKKPFSCQLCDRKEKFGTFCRKLILSYLGWITKKFTSFIFTPKLSFWANITKWWLEWILGL